MSKKAGTFFYPPHSSNFFAVIRRCGIAKLSWPISSFLLLVAMPFVTSYLLLVVMPLFLVVMPGATSSYRGLLRRKLREARPTGAAPCRGETVSYLFSSCEALSHICHCQVFGSSDRAWDDIVMRLGRLVLRVAFSFLGILCRQGDTYLRC